ncbi:F-actin-uncapping protein LRRC16A isoform X2 [Planococcus citri]|uniref:F-actin-uncapping protein LRRC16A isoform X2 n=1 Tax=Planococcus citri TaxID=170843 RepID=UPI0031F933E1
MSTRSQLTKDLNESVKLLLGKHVKILLKNVVKFETKAEKTENRVLVFSPCRFFLLTAKIPTRVDSHCHYLEIQGIESRKSNQLSFAVNDKLYTFYTSEECGSQEVDAMIQALHTAIHTIFPVIPFSYIIRKIDVFPESRVQYLDEPDRFTNEVRGMAPCGGFSTQYACMCDYHGLPYREEVAWDVDTIYQTHNTRELCLRDFDYLDPKDLVPIISALEFNTWFTKLRAHNIKLTHEALERLLHVMKKSLSIEELYLDGIGVRWDFAHKLSLSLIANGNTMLHTIDLSNNLIEDKGASSLCGFIAKINQGTSHIKSPISKVPKGLIHLSLAHCGLTCKGVSHIAHALSVNKCMPDTLTHLNLSGNNLKDDVTNLCNFLAQPNVISHLDISKTDCSLETIFGALLRGCATNLITLNVSHNVFSTKKSKELPPSFKQFFTSSIGLKSIVMSYCKLPLDALKNLLLGLACNETIADVALDISCNNLGSQGAHVLESCVHGVRSIASLDITENNMDVELASVITAVSKNKSIKHFHMGRNVINVRAKHICVIMEALVRMIQEEDCVLQTLSIPDCKLKSDLYSLINALGGNQCLATLDISGNLMGDAGARLLGKALQINAHLKNILYDRNNITLQGYADLAYALESNYTLKHMPFPVHDIVACMKISAEKTENIMKKIQDILHRNVSPKRYHNGHAYRLQQGFLLSSTQHVVDKLIGQIQETLKSELTPDNRNDHDLEYASRLIQDANNSKHLLSYLHDVILKNEQNAANPVDAKLRSVSEELHSTIANHLRDTTESIIKCAQLECPTVFENEQFQRDIKTLANVKNCLENEFVRSCIVEQAGAHIMNKINDLNLAVAAHVSDKVTDEIIESLSTCTRSLARDGSKRRSLTPDVLPGKLRMGSESSHLDHSDSLSSLQTDDRSPIATPHLNFKRISIHGKPRPKSVVDCVELGISVDDIPNSLPCLQSSTEESLDSVSELPRSVNQQLQHLAKSRPKRAKTKPPSRSHIRATEEGVSEDDGDGDTSVSASATLVGETPLFKSGSATSSSATPLISPTSDDSVSSILTDAVTPSQTSPVNPDGNLECDRKNASAICSPKSNHNSLPKKSHLQYVEDDVSRSKSSDNLNNSAQNYSVSPLARRMAAAQFSAARNESGVARSGTDENTSITIADKNSANINHNNYNNTTSTNKKDVDNGGGGGGSTTSITRSITSATISNVEPAAEPDSDYLPEKKSVREMAASLIKNSNVSPAPGDHRKIENGCNFARLRHNLLPTPFTQPSASASQDVDSSK